jgi:hypothetical protein
MATGLFLQTAGFVWVAIAGSLSTSWVELDIALLIAVASATFAAHGHLGTPASVTVHRRPSGCFLRRRHP